MSQKTDSADERAAGFAARHFRWNFGILLVDGIGFFAGLAFFDPNTVLPVLLKELGAADWQVGLSRLILTLGFALPSLLAAHWIHGRAEHKGFLIKACAIGRIPLLTIPGVLIWHGTSNPGLALTWFFFIYAIFWLLDGGCAVSWFDIVGKTIPGRYRGRFFGALQTSSGLAAMGSGAIVALVLGSPRFPFPYEFAFLAGLWCVGALFSQISLFFIREPPGEVDSGPKPGFRTYLRNVVPLLKQNPRLSRLILARFLLDGGALAAPFYVLFARENLHVTLQTVGIYTVLVSIGKVSTGPLWGWISDHFGPVIGFRAVAVSVVTIPMLALIAAGCAPWALPISFFLLGAVQDGLWMTGSTVMLESVADRDRPLVIGVAALLQSPSAIYGVTGGVIAQTFSYPVVFSGTLIVTTAGLFAAMRLSRAADSVESAQ